MWKSRGRSSGKLTGMGTGCHEEIDISTECLVLNRFEWVRNGGKRHASKGIHDLNHQRGSMED